MGNDGLSLDLDRDGADLWQALRYFRAQTHFYDRRNALPGRFGALGGVAVDVAAYPLPRFPGNWCGRINANCADGGGRSVYAPRAWQMAGHHRRGLWPLVHRWSDGRGLDLG